MGGREYIIGKAGRKTGRWSKEGKRDPIEDDSGDGDELEQRGEEAATARKTRQDKARQDKRKAGLREDGQLQKFFIRMRNQVTGRVEGPGGGWDRQDTT